MIPKIKAEDQTSAVRLGGRFVRATAKDVKIRAKLLTSMLEKIRIDANFTEFVRDTTMRVEISPLSLCENTLFLLYASSSNQLYVS